MDPDLHQGGLIERRIFMGIDIQGMFDTFYTIIGFFVLMTVVLAVLWGFERKKHRKD